MFHRAFRHWDWPRGERFFQKGGFKYLVLDLLKDRPRYGYEIIQELEEKFHGFYAPSPGIVYPTLQWLEEMGYVTSSQQDNKKIYTITEEGRRFLSEQKKVTDDIKNQMRTGWEWCSSEICDDFRYIMNELGDLWRLMARPFRKMDEEKMQRIREVISKAREEIISILKE